MDTNQHRRTATALGAALKSSNITVRDLSVAAGVPQEIIARELSDAPGDITLDQLAAVSGSLGVNPFALTVGAA